MKNLTILIIAVLLISCNNQNESTTDAKSQSYFKTWQHYLGDPEQTHFSELNEIDTTNVNQLKLLWSYKSGGLIAGQTTQIQTNPIIIGDKLIGVNASLRLFAVNAATGKELWTFESTTRDKSGLGGNRGFAYWESDGKEKSRLFFSSGYSLLELSNDNFYKV